MTLCTFSPSEPGCLGADQSPPDKMIKSRAHGRVLRTGLFRLLPGRNGYRELKRANLGQAGDRSDLRIKVSAVRKLFHYDGADMVQQGLLVHRVLHLRDFLQVTQLKAFSLEINGHTATQSGCGTGWNEKSKASLQFKRISILAQSAKGAP